MLTRLVNKILHFITGIVVALAGMLGVKFFADQWILYGYLSAFPLAGVSMIVFVIGLLWIVNSVYGEEER